MIDAQAVAYIASVDGEGFPNLKAMSAPRVREGLRTFYLTTNTSSMRDGRWYAGCHSENFETEER